MYMLMYIPVDILMYVQVIYVAVPWLSRVYVICTLSAVLCIPTLGIHKTALKVQITYTLE